MSSNESSGFRDELLAQQNQLLTNEFDSYGQISRRQFGKNVFALSGATIAGSQHLLRPSRAQADPFVAAAVVAGTWVALECGSAFVRWCMNYFLDVNIKGNARQYQRQPTPVHHEYYYHVNTVVPIQFVGMPAYLRDEETEKVRRDLERERLELEKARRDLELEREELERKLRKRRETEERNECQITEGMDPSKQGKSFRICPRAIQDDIWMAADYADLEAAEGQYVTATSPVGKDKEIFSYLPLSPRKYFDSSLRTNAVDRTEGRVIDILKEYRMPDGSEVNHEIWSIKGSRHYRDQSKGVRMGYVLIHIEDDTREALVIRTHTGGKKFIETTFPANKPRSVDLLRV